MRSSVVLAGILAAVSVSAQYSEFAVTDDGRLFFSSPMSMGPGDTRSKVYKLTSDGPALVAKGDGDNILGPLASSPLTSGDGSITGYAIFTPCQSPSCGLFSLPRTVFYLQGAGPTSLSYNSLQISRNGRFLMGGTFDARTSIIELPSGATRDLPQYYYRAGLQSITETGEVLVNNTAIPGSTLMRKPLDGDFLAVPGTEKTWQASISPNGEQIVYERLTESTYDLYITDRQGASHRRLASVPFGLEAPWPVGRFQYRPSFSNDGTLVYIQPTESGEFQSMILSPGGEPRMLTHIEAGVQNLIVSGNGAIAWIGTYTGQLLRASTSDGTVSEAIPPSVYVGGFLRSTLRGSVVRLYSNAVRPDTIFELDGRPLPISEITRDGAAVQIPWDYTGTGGSQAFRVQGPRSPFVQLLAFTPLDAPAVSFEQSNVGALQAAHQDFHGVVSASDPARAGETVHIFARNLGPVDQPVLTGERSPISPPARITTPFACYLFETLPASPTSRVTGLVVPFAGLAGGSIGIYQIDVTIPVDWKTGVSQIGCLIQSSGNLQRGDYQPINILSAN